MYVAARLGYIVGREALHLFGMSGNPLYGFWHHLQVNQEHDTVS
jgi:hypothetical protein